ncbi:MAG TPA: extracellular solute-binding protein [Erysipelothrix sp.]|nr:extracellular solute-binding protein [Erysipelothrix sp.]
MKKILILLCTLALILVLVVTKQESDTIIVYASSEQFRNDAMQVQLSEAFPHLNVRVMYTPTAKAAAKLSVEKENTDADIVVGLETSYMSKITDSLADISGYSKLEYLDELKPENQDNKYLVWERQAGAFIINTDILNKNNLPMPKSYEDLLDPVYKGFIAMPDPKSSGTGYFFYKNLVNTKGEEGALAYIDTLEKNVKQFTESGSGPIKLLNQGEIAIGLALTFQAVNHINKGLPFEILFPEEGSPYSLTGTGLIKGRENNPDVVEVFKFLVNDFIMYDKINFTPEQIFKVQENSIPNYPSNIPYADMSGIESIEDKEYLLSLWKY